MSTPVKTHKGYLLGPKLQDWEIAVLCRNAGWRDRDLIDAVAVCLSESAGRVKARCENFIDGKHVSTDFGLFEHNFSVEKITPELLRELYDPVKNVNRAYRRWKTEGFRPWHGYTNNIALNPEMRGKYIQRANWAVMNLHRQHYGMKGIPSPYIRLGPKRLVWWIEHPELKS